MTSLFERSSALFGNGTNPLATHDHHLLLQEFENLKQSDVGWKQCVEHLVQNQISNDQEKFFSLQIIEHYLKSKYKLSEEQDQLIVRQFMSSWLQTHVKTEESFISRKAAQIFALIAVVDFPHRWKSFFTDLLQTCFWSLENIDFYLKILLALNAEVIDRDIPHTTQETNVARDFKDYIRESCMNELVDSWFKILTEHTQNSPIICETLRVIGAYVSWIDIDLVMNERFLQFFAFSMGQQVLRQATCECIEEIINKGMEASAKLKIVDVLWDTVIKKHADNIINENDSDYLLKLGKMINAIGTNMTEGWQKSFKRSQSVSGLFLATLESRLSYVLCLLSNPDDDVSQSVSEYCQNYIILVKNYPQRSEQQQKYVQETLKIIMNKSKYDEDYDFEHEGEEEAEFLEYRKEIRLIFDSIASLDYDIVLNTVQEMIFDVTRTWQTKSLQDVENSLHFLYMLGEALPPTQGNILTCKSTKTEQFNQMLQSLITNNVCFHPHHSVKLQYFENLVRYSRYFYNFNHLIEAALDHFIGVNGLHNDDIKVRTRVTYLFSRFIKEIKSLLNTHVEKILNSVQDLLLMFDCDLSLAALNARLVYSDDQLFLYETVSILIISCNLPIAVKSQLMKTLLAPIINYFPIVMQQYQASHNENEKLILAKYLKNMMLVATRVSKGFSQSIKLKDCDSTEIFVQVLRSFLDALNITTHKNLIHLGVRQYLHRMVIVLEGSEILEYFPLMLEHLVKSNDSKDVQDFFPLVIQMIAKFKKLTIPLLSRAFALISNSMLKLIYELSLETNDSDSQMNCQNLRKSYCLFLMALINNDVLEIVTSQETNVIIQVFECLIQGTKNTPTSSFEMQKLCFQILKRFIEHFVKEENVSFFAQFTMQNIVPACFEIILKSNLDFNDAQQTLVLNEICSFLNSLYKKFGEEFTSYLQINYLPSLNISPHHTENIIQMIKSNASKSYKILKQMYG